MTKKGYDYTELTPSITSVRKKIYTAIPILTDEDLDKLLSDEYDILCESTYDYNDKDSIVSKSTKNQIEFIAQEKSGKIFDTKNDSLDDHIRDDINEDDILESDDDEEENVVSPDVNKILSEATLTSKQRQKLKDNQFGLPRLRKYPLHDRAHVNMAIRFFKFVKKESDRKLLASNIIQQYNKLNMTTKVGKNNPLYKYISDDMKQETINEEVHVLPKVKELELKDNIFIPVYILFTSNATVLGKIIKTATNSAYSHVSITTDAALDKMYSFAGNDTSIFGGLKVESISDGIFSKLKDKGSTYSLYVTFISKDKFKKMEDKLNDILANVTKYTYNFIGLIKYLFKIKSTDQYKKFCSQFVAELLKEADDNLITDDPSLLAPIQLITPKFYHLSSGELKDYDKKHTLTKMRNIIKSNKIIQYMTENSIYYNNIFYNKSFAKEITITKEWKLLDTFFPSFKMAIPVRMATSLGGLYGNVKDNMTPEDLEIAMEVNYNKEYNRYKIENRDLEHIQFCIQLYNIFNAIMRNPISYKDGNGDTINQILSDWFTLIKYHNALLNETEKNSNEYKLQCQYLHELLWEPEDDPFSDEIISNNILAFAEALGEINIINDTVNENYELLDPNQVYSYMVEKLDTSEDIFLLKDMNMYPIFDRQSIRMAMDIINDIDEVNKDEFVTRLNQKYILFGCRFKIPASHPYAKYALDVMVDFYITLDMPRLIAVNRAAPTNIADRKPTNIDLNKYLDESCITMDDLNNIDMRKYKDKFISMNDMIEKGSTILHNKIEYKVMEVDSDILHLEDKDGNKHAIQDEDVIYINESVKISGSISFPKDEHEDLIERLKDGKHIITIRVSNEYGKYKLDNIYSSKLGHDLKVTKIDKLKSINDYKYYNELTKDQILLLNKYDKLDVIYLNKVESIDESISIKDKLKSYVFDIDEEGNIMISQKESADFEKHYKNSLKLLKIYKNTNNIIGMKNELCRLYYMASIIEQYHMDYSKKDIDRELQRDMINLRSLILNTFSFYLKLIMKSEPNFDFREYFDKTLYGETLKIKKKAIEGFIKLSKAVIAAMS